MSCQAALQTDAAAPGGVQSMERPGDSRFNPLACAGRPGCRSDPCPSFPAHAPGRRLTARVARQTHVQVAVSPWPAAGIPPRGRLSVPVRSLGGGLHQLRTSLRTAQAGRNHGHAQVLAHRLVIGRAEDHGRVFRGVAADRFHDFARFAHLQRAAGGDVDQHAASAVQVHAFQQRAMACSAATRARSAPDAEAVPIMAWPSRP